MPSFSKNTDKQMKEVKLGVFYTPKSSKKSQPKMDVNKLAQEFRKVMNK